MADTWPSSSVSLPIVALLIWIAYIFGLAIYRVYLSPIANFPGPKLAALTYWYEFYHEVILRGQYTFRINDWHDKYGPIIRVTPDELHIRDSDHWDELYGNNPKADKYERFAIKFGNNSSMFTTSNAALHRIRRAALSPMFSKRQITNLLPVIQQKVDLVCSRLSEYVETGEVLAISNIWAAFAADVITEYAFSLCYDQLKSPGCAENFRDAFLAMSEFGHLAVQFPWIMKVVKSLPDSISERMNPPLSRILKFQRDLRVMLSRIASGDSQRPKNSGHPTIFEEVLRSNLPRQEKSFHRLGEEAQLVVGAAVMTTAGAMSIASFHIIDQPRIYEKLREELREAFSDPSAPIGLLQLERLPYLRGCVQEGIRLSYGLSSRQPRISDTPTRYKDWVIPAHAPVGMNIIDVHHDEELYPDSHSFIPERWLGNPKAPNGSPLDRYFVAFGKGPRSCLGINMAYAELYLGLGTVFRRFAFELYETDVTDVELAHDFTLPSPRLDSKGVRVRVKPFDI
ncbi:hypothetical protein W97_01391 [Coniosporium apollinis CBS 100218]|uniref:Cytochrome P450 n=1 Tax=Coniosporium apollinis (strain CBS 100218) TaxID=1168221 RepID=R7YKN0_CONA1|nr:uncharacterized protein W97_01391 [Coniosporium apollinis CBS 100218]EON62171.1 hypothetical protein W97_01391 [Coniosporium apollinis CBS 100218]